MTSFEQGVKMKLSKETLEIVKNFSAINQNLLIKGGTTLSTLSTNKTVFGNATVKDSFPSEFGIYDLNQFLGVLSLFEDPELDFKETHVVISEKGNSVKYYNAAKNTLVTPQKDIVFPETDSIVVKLSKGALANIHKASNILGHKDLQITGDGSKVTVNITDKKAPSSNSYNFVLGDTDKTFDIFVKIENLKMIPNDYTLTVSPKKISRFANAAGDLVYYVAVESDSTFA
jgi:hypothetical protein